MDFSTTAVRAFWRHPFNAKKRINFRRARGVLGTFDPAYRPTVSAIVPNYNHAPFLERRLQSILHQTYRDLEVILLDDCSTDDSRTVIQSLTRDYPQIRVIYNETNSGNVFKQWRKGIASATGELVWICESDDYAELTFLQHLVRYFRDPSIMLAFGRIQYCDRSGTFVPGLDAYREGAEPGIWRKPITRPASQWFCNAFGVNNVVANVGGCLFRRQDLSDEVWREAESYSVVGDWYLYAQIAGGGQIAFDPGAVSYFRQHGQNTSVSSFTRANFYHEHQRLMLHLRENWDVPDETVKKFYGKVAAHYAHFNGGGPIPDAWLEQSALLQQHRKSPHLLISMLGFFPGGGEIFPIHLANALQALGCQVSVMTLETQAANPDVRAMLDPKIPVYEGAWIKRYGAERFLRDAGISLIHSHVVYSEAFFFKHCGIDPNFPYLVTLHGSYEACKVSDEDLILYSRAVDHFVYVADKNIIPLQRTAHIPANASKFRNAMPIDHRPYPKSRSEMGIAADAIVFTLISRAIPSKGWAESIIAFTHLREMHPDTKMYLLLCGSGEEADRLKVAHRTDPDISFLGFQSCVHGLYALSDCAIVPTRFAGESFPLCIIQALQMGTPVIATDIGEVANMIGAKDKEPAGLLIDFTEDTKQFVRGLVEAMQSMLAQDRRQLYAQAAQTLGKTYDMPDLARNYRRLYEDVLTKAKSVSSTKAVVKETVF